MAASRPGYPPASLAFDRLMASLAALAMAGVVQDGWAHKHGLVDQSFMTPWHAALYGSMALSGIVLAVAGIRNLRRGYGARRGLPFGYWTAAIGVVLFLLGGVFDLWWHTRFGIESDIEGLISPSHLWLALAGGLVFSAPMRSVARRYGPASGGWGIALPVVLSAAAVVSLLGFFTAYAQPIADSTMVSVLAPHPAAPGGALYAVRPSGAVERIAAVPGADLWGAAVSPNGRWIAYRRANGGGPASAIVVARADGSDPRTVTHSGRHDSYPAWSPDGTALAYTSGPAGTSGHFQLHVVRPDGSDDRILVDQVAFVAAPAWSPNGSAIAFASRNGLTDQIAEVPATGGAIRWIAGTAGGSWPAWSARGLLFSRGSDLALLAPGRTIARTVIRSASMPVWMRNDRIAFVRDAAGSVQIFSARADGSDARDLTGFDGLDASRPSLAANGTVYLTASGRPIPAYAEIGEVFAMDAAMISTVVLAGIVLLCIRRWRMPPGAITLLVGLFAMAMATQNDEYFALPALVAAGVLADVTCIVFGERVRGGPGFALLAFGFGACTFGFYQTAVAWMDGLGWPADLALGSPIVAGFSGLLVAFCFDPPLRPSTSDALELGQDLRMRIPVAEQRRDEPIDALT